MAADAVVGDVGVIEVGRDPSTGRVAVVAVIATDKVGRVLARGGGAVMAGETGANDLGVIDQVGRYKGHVVVAVLADIGRIDMGRMLARRIGAVMAADAVVGDVGVIEVGRDRWVGCLPVAVVPSWQEKQVPTTWVWSTTNTGSQDELLWQSSQIFAVLMCPLPFPVASKPLWQEKQPPVMLA
jgi:hypothetical protein